jgi:hypothetical protein
MKRKKLTNAHRGRPRKNRLTVGDRQVLGHLEVLDPDAGVKNRKRMCVCICRCGKCKCKKITVAIYRFKKEETRSCHSLRRENYAALKRGELKSKRMNPSLEQMKFHGAMMRHLRTCLNDEVLDLSDPTTDKALKYVKRLKSEDDLRNTIAKGLTGEFSIEKDISYVDRVLALEAVGAKAKDNANSKGNNLDPNEQSASGTVVAIASPEEDLEEHLAKMTPADWQEIRQALNDEPPTKPPQSDEIGPDDLPW